MKRNRLSNTAVDKYLECSLCYKLHYLEYIRPVRGKSALLFGGALDKALNHLLLTKNLQESLDMFHRNWLMIDDVMTDFSKSDLDEELVEYYGIPSSEYCLSWSSLLYKGRLFIYQYHKDILPRIKNVIAVQEPVSLKNAEGDEIAGALDLIVEWEDGKTYLLDNKSSSVKYAPDSAKTGQQLPLYYYIVKDRYKLDGIGYIVLSKKINKNKVKRCKECDIINEGNHKTCNNMVDHTIVKAKVRCCGEFEITINPSVDWEVILNTVDEEDEKRVLETFDNVNNAILNEEFATEHPEKKNKYFQFCPYKEYYPGNPDFIKLERRKDK